MKNDLDWSELDTTHTIESSAIGTIAYRHPRGPALRAEVKSFAELRAIGTDGHLSRPVRLDFHAILLTRRGGGEHAVDFIVHPLSDGTVLMTHPGQVQRFGLDPRAEGDVVLFTPSAVGNDPVVAALLDAFLWPVSGRVHPAERSAIDRALSALRDAIMRPQSDGVARSLIQHELCALVIRLHRQLADGAPSPDVDPLFTAFARAVEHGYAHTRDVGTYAGPLGCSQRTLARAVLRVRGQTPKEYIDGRVALEAKRALAHADEPVATIAARLGFSEPTNFTKFFARMTGTSPAAFRAEFAAAVERRSVQPGAVR